MRSEESLPTPSKSSINIPGWIALFISCAAIAISIFNFYCIKNNKASTRIVSNMTQQETATLQVLQQKLDALQKTQQTQAHNVFHETMDTSAQKTFSDINALGQQIQQLSSIPARPMMSVNNDTETNKLSDQHLNWHQRIVEKFKSLKHLFVIRRVESANTPVIAVTQEIMLKQNILMQLNIAQWGLLRHDPVVYQTALKTVSRWISRYFLASDARKRIVDQLTTLIAIPVGAPLSTAPDMISPPAKTPIEINTPTPPPKPSDPKLDNMPASVET